MLGMRHERLWPATFALVAMQSICVLTHTKSKQIDRSLLHARVEEEIYLSNSCIVFFCGLKKVVLDLTRVPLREHIMAENQV